MNPGALSQALLMSRRDIDPYFSNVVSLLHFDGTTNDRIGSAWSLANGAALTSTPGDFLSGTGALDCSSNIDARCVRANTGVGTGDFCMELWFKDKNILGKNQYLMLFDSGLSTVRFYCPTAFNVHVDISGVGPTGSGPVYTYNTWHHIAVSRSGSNWTFWFNGTAASTWTNSTFNGGTASTIWLGSGSSLGTGLLAYIDEWRFTKGVPRYTAPFTPTYPFPNQ